ncbi:MAG: hypothetical protein AVDCRST_MAG11-3530, partial [uncultured Gemmatimonadaceae bacterium]
DPRRRHRPDPRRAARAPTRPRLAADARDPLGGALPRRAGVLRRRARRQRGGPQRAARRVLLLLPPVADAAGVLRGRGRRGDDAPASERRGVSRGARAPAAGAAGVRRAGAAPAAALPRDPRRAALRRVLPALPRPHARGAGGAVGPPVVHRRPRARRRAGAAGAPPAAASRAADARVARRTARAPRRAARRRPPGGGRALHPHPVGRRLDGRGAHRGEAVRGARDVLSRRLRAGGVGRGVADRRPRAAGSARARRRRAGGRLRASRSRGGAVGVVRAGGPGRGPRVRVRRGRRRLAVGGDGARVRAPPPAPRDPAAALPARRDVPGVPPALHNPHGRRGAVRPRVCVGRRAIRRAGRRRARREPGGVRAAAPDRRDAPAHRVAAAPRGGAGAAGCRTGSGPADAPRRL